MTGCVMLTIAQWYNCSITFFYIENENKNPEKCLLKKGLHFGEDFYSSSKQVSTSLEL